MAGRTPKTETTEPVLTGETSPDGPSPFDPQAVGRVAAVVNIKQIELIGAHFERADGGPFSGLEAGEAAPQIGVSAEWALASNRESLGCLVTFSATFDEESEEDPGAPVGPYYLYARFRLIYEVEEGENQLTGDDLQQFVQWNAVFNAWPYWREYLSSTINRAQLPKFLVPVMGVPRAS